MKSMWSLPGSHLTPATEEVHVPPSVWWTPWLLRSWKVTSCIRLTSPKKKSTQRNIPWRNSSTGSTGPKTLSSTPQSFAQLSTLLTKTMIITSQQRNFSGPQPQYLKDFARKLTSNASWSVKSLRSQSMRGTLSAKTKNRAKQKRSSAAINRWRNWRKSVFRDRQDWSISKTTPSSLNSIVIWTASSPKTNSFLSSISRMTASLSQLFPTSSKAWHRKSAKTHASMLAQLGPLMRPMFTQRLWFTRTKSKSSSIGIWISTKMDSFVRKSGPNCSRRLMSTEIRH